MRNMRSALEVWAFRVVRGTLKPHNFHHYAPDKRDSEVFCYPSGFWRFSQFCFTGTEGWHSHGGVKGKGEVSFRFASVGYLSVVERP